jgi:hypothetical protein
LIVLRFGIAIGILEVPNQHMQQLVINYEIPIKKSHYLALLRLIIPIRVITIGRNHQMHFLS